jgi:hypothetical protein
MRIIINVLVMWCCLWCCVQGLTDRGLNCLACLPSLAHLSLGFCPAISASGLASLLLSGSSSMRDVALLCCAGVRPADVQAVQEAVWAITRRHVTLTWSRHNPARP